MLGEDVVSRGRERGGNKYAIGAEEVGGGDERGEECRLIDVHRTAPREAPAVVRPPMSVAISVHPCYMPCHLDTLLPSSSGGVLLQSGPPT